jgi:hypothetical protein
MATKDELDDGLTDEERLALADEDGGEAATNDNDTGSGDGEDDAGNDGEGGDAGAGDDTGAGQDDGADGAGDANDDAAAAGDEPPAAQASAPILVAEAPQDAEAQLAAIATQKDELSTKFDDGDITSKEYQAELDKLNKAERAIELDVHKAQIAADMEQQRLRNAWITEANAFAKQHGYTESPRHYKMLDQEVKDIASSDEGKGMTGAQILAKAHENLVKDGVAPKGAAKPAETGKGKTPRENAPPSLHTTPAAEVEVPGAGKYALLDRLAETDPLKYEETLNAMSKAEREAYLAA